MRKKKDEPPVTHYEPCLFYKKILEKHDMNQITMSCVLNAARIIKLEQEVKEMDQTKKANLEEIQKLNHSIIVQTLIAAENVQNMGISLSYREIEKNEEDEV